MRRAYAMVGGTSGIGREAALAVARRGDDVLVVGRDEARGTRTVRELRAAGAGDAAWLGADLSTLAGMEDAAAGILAWRPVLNGIVHSAMSVPSFLRRTVTADGFEWVFALQYLARAGLNQRLRDALAASGDGRIVHVAASPPRRWVPDIDDLQLERGRWWILRSLMSSQVLGFLHAQEAAVRWADLPVAVDLACVGPTATDTTAGLPWPVRALYRLVATTPERAARNTVRYLTDATRRGGTVCHDPATFAPEPVRYDPSLAAALWERTSTMLGGPTADGRDDPAGVRAAHEEGPCT